MNTEDPDEQKADASMWALIEQASYLPVYLHLETEISDLLLSNGIDPIFRFQQRKKRRGQLLAK